MDNVDLDVTKQGIKRRTFVTASAALAATAAVGAGGLSLTGCSPSDEEATGVVSGADGQTVHLASGYNCAYCFLKGTVKDGKVVSVEPGDLPYRPEANNACGRCMAYPSKVQDENARVMYPMKRTGERGSGEFEQISWDEAIETIAEKLNAVLAKNPRAASFWVMTGNMLSLAWQSPIRMAHCLGASTWAMEAIMGDHGESVGMTMTCGDPAPGHDGGDYVNSNYLLFFAANKVDSAAPVARHIAEARRQGAKLVVVDPRMSSTAAIADQWVPIKPGTDSALMLAMMKIIFENNLEDATYLANYSCAPLLVRDDTGEYIHPSEGTFAAWDTATDAMVEIKPEDAGGPDDQTSGPESTLALTGSFTVDGVACHPTLDDLKAQAQTWPLDRASEVTGVDAAVIEQIALEYARAKPAALMVTQGSNRCTYTYAASRAGVTLATVCGYIGKSGGGAGREQIGVPIQTSGDAVNFASAGSLFNDGEYYDIGEGSETFGLWLEGILGPYGPRADEYEAAGIFKSSEFYDAAITGDPTPVDFLYIATSNFINNSPDANKVINEVFPAIDFIVTADPFHTWTTKYSDIVLPVTSYWENWDVGTDGPYVRLNQPNIPRMGECLSDTEIMSLLAKKVGVEQYWSRTDEEWVRMFLESEHPGMASFNMEEMEQNGVFGRDDGIYEPTYPFGDKVFATATGRLEFYTDSLVPFGEQVPTCQRVENNPESAFKEQYPLEFIQYHNRTSVHTQGILPEAMRAIETEPYLFMHTQDAQARGIAHEDVVRVFNDRGQMKLKAFVTEGIIPGVTATPHGWTPEHFVEGHYQLLTNYTKNEAEEFLSNTSSPFNENRVQVEKA